MHNRNPNTFCDNCLKPVYSKPKNLKYNKFCSKECRTKFRFFSKVDRINGLLHPLYGRCWEWTGSLLDNRYGSMSKDGKTVSAHRFSYEYFIGEIPDGLNVLHKCDNKICVRPQHLFIGSFADNSRDMVDKGRHCSKNIVKINQKLTIRDVKEIKSKFSIGFSNHSLAEEYKVSERHMRDIRRGKSWMWV